MGNTLRKYLDDISRYPLLTREEEIALGKRIKRGDRDAVEEMWTANLRLSAYIARQYVDDSDSRVMDLIQEGNIGLQKAAGRFDYKRGVKFSSYAVWWIRESILRYMADTYGGMRVPINYHNLRKKVWDARKEAELYGIELSTEQIAEKTCKTPGKIKELEAIFRTADTLSLGHPYDKHDKSGDAKHVGYDKPDGMFASPEEAALRDEVPGITGSLLQGLNPKERAVIKRRFGIGGKRQWTLEEIGESMDLSRERIRQ
ncbi:MAG: RNA polymerase sigma factor RpoD/SigA, partial [Candidatus Aenigmarchaeota archaeon]|nr:RNA polymerase sigma factor RpoD/SigA [Candidatus Aenigmarchaeota archaeon]